MLHFYEYKERMQSDQEVVRLVPGLRTPEDP